MEVVGLITCGRVVLGQGANFPQREVRRVFIHDIKDWRCRAAGTARWSERWWGTRWSDGRSRRDQKQRSQCAWIMKMTMGWTKIQTWAKVCVHLNKEDSQATMTLTDNSEKRYYEKRRIFNAWWLLHWHQLRSQISQVFQVTSHIVGILALHFVSPIQLLSLYQFIQFLTCTRIPCRDSHCENGLVRCCIYTPRRLH